MKVHELISKLQKLDQNTSIRINTSKDEIKLFEFVDVRHANIDISRDDDAIIVMFGGSNSIKYTLITLTDDF